MKYLLDTHTLLWAMKDDERLPNKIKSIINNNDNAIFVSVASFWEVEIKHIKNPEIMPIKAVDLINASIDSDYRIEEIRDEYLARLHEIVEQNIHRDPFDHMILSTALNEEMTLITHDEALAKYKGVKVIVY